MKNIGKSALIVAVIGAITFSAYTINIVSTSESKVKGLEMKKNQQDTLEPAGVVPFVLGCETYEPIGVSELPQEIRSEVASRYVAYAKKYNRVVMKKWMSLKSEDLMNIIGNTYT